VRDCGIPHSRHFARDDYGVVVVAAGAVVVSVELVASDGVVAVAAGAVSTGVVAEPELVVVVVAVVAVRLVVVVLVVDEVVAVLPVVVDVVVVVASGCASRPLSFSSCTICCCTAVTCASTAEGVTFGPSCLIASSC
jgi:hypothetical protein